MAEQQGAFISVDGQEMAVADFINLGRTAGLATDRVLAELLRFIPYDGTNVYKTILPGYLSSVQGVPNAWNATVGTRGATGTVFVYPFTAIIGSRALSGAAPTDPTWSGPRQALSDLRSSVFTGTSAMPSTLAISANSSGNTRWDLVYATVSVDMASGNATRRVKTASSSTPQTQMVPTYLGNPVAVYIAQGTPGASPTLPALPADAGGNFNVAIAAIRVPTGFTSTSTVAPGDIRDLVGNANLTNGGGQTIARLAPSTGAFSGPIPASGNNDRAGTINTNFPWGAAGGSGRPSCFLPPSMMGGVQVFGEIDLSDASTPSHANGSIFDDSIDWRGRFLLVFVALNQDAKFPNDPSATAFVPGFGESPLPATTWAMAQTLAADGVAASGAATVLLLNDTSGVGMPSGSQVGLYVATSGPQLSVYVGSTPSQMRLFVWIMASAQFPNL